MAAWLLLVHQIPSTPTSVRVRTWRRLQELGAVSLKNSVWVLPASDQAREDFEWMKREIEAMKGGAVVFAADSVDSYSNDDIIAAFREARAEDYQSLTSEAAAIGRQLKRGGDRTGFIRQVRALEARLLRLDGIAFYPPPDRDKAAAAVAALQVAARPAPAAGAANGQTRRATSRYSKRTWVTRPRPGIDRMSSAWLIRRFIDPQARFAFADKLPDSPALVPFDMFGAEFGHVGGGCTFETLASRFGVSDAAVEAIGEIVHDLDLKETRFARPETPAFGRLVDGLRATYADDHALLEQGIVIFEALYRSFERTEPTAPQRRRPKGSHRRR